MLNTINLMNYLRNDSNVYIWGKDRKNEKYLVSGENCEYFYLL